MVVSGNFSRFTNRMSPGPDVIFMTSFNPLFRFSANVGNNAENLSKLAYFGKLREDGYAAEVAMKKVVPAFNFNLMNSGTTGNAAEVAQRFGMNPTAFDQAAEKYWTSGQLPPAGRGGPALALNKALMNRAADLHPEGSLAANSAEYKANAASYKNVTTTLDTLSAFEQSGLKNLKQFTDLADKIPDTGVPWLNTPVRLLNDKLVGAEYMPAIAAARSVALREIARVTNDPKLSGSLTDTARAEVSSFSPQNATLPQIKQVVKVLQNDMANVHSSLQDQKDSIAKRLGGVPSGSFSVQAPNGKTYTFNDQDSLDSFKKRAGIK